jgi:hypothetical protein
MLNIFRPMPVEARRENRAAYQQFLRARDGLLDMEKRTLSLREEAMARYEKPLSRLREIDRDLFDAQYSRYDRALATPPEALLLLALVKVNAAEAFGVDTTFEKALRETTKHGDALELTLLVEELYHTRILLSSAALYGLEVVLPYKPPLGFRAVIFGIGRAPEFISRPLILASEILGTLLFSNLLKKAGEILRQDRSQVRAIAQDHVSAVENERAEARGDVDGVTQSRRVAHQIADQIQ